MVVIDEPEGFELSQLEKNASERIKRLEELRKKAQSQGANRNGDETPLGILNPRSYRTVTSGITDVGGEVRTVMEQTESEIQNIVEDAKNIQLGDELDITVLAPKRVNWDLKRGIKEQLEKLERRTQKAIVQIVRERIREEKPDLASAVNTVSRNDLEN